MFMSSSRAFGAIALALGTAAFSWCDDFFRLWVGQAYIEPDKVTGVSVPGLFRLLVISQVFTCANAMCRQYLMASRRLSLLARLFAAEAVANLTLSVILVQWIGLRGVALGTAIPAVCCQGLVLPYLAIHRLGIPVGSYLRQVAWPCLSFALVAASIVGIWHSMVHPRELACLLRQRWNGRSDCWGGQSVPCGESGRA